MGVATWVGVILMLMPKATLFVFLVWLILVLLTRYVSLGSIVAAALVPVFACLSMSRQNDLFGLAAAIFVIYRHKSNIGDVIKWHGEQDKSWAIVLDSI